MPIGCIDSFCFLPSGSGGKETKMQGYNDFSRKKAWEDPNCPCFLSEDGKYYCYRVWDSELKRVVIEKHEVGKGEYTEDITLILADTDHDHYLNERYQNELKDPLFQKKLSDREGQGNAEGEDAPDPWDDRSLSSKGPEDALFAEPEKENPQVAKVREVVETQSESPNEIKVDENHDNSDIMDGEIEGSKQDVSSSETDDETAAESDTRSGETTETDEPQEKKGGSYRDVKKTSDGETHEVHHMPADSSTDLERDDGPAIKMEKDDHRQTASCGNSREAREYRERQRELIEQGKFREALQMDIDDLHDKFGDKYDDAIAEMLEYVDQLEKEGKING